MGTEVAIIVTFAVSVLLFLSNFGLCGAVGEVCRSVQLGIFGTVGYLAPVLLFTGICFYLSNRGNRRAVIKIVSVSIVLLALCGLDQMLFGGGMIPSYILVQKLGMLNTAWAMLIPGAMSVYNMIVARTFIQSNIPDELLEAAQIDGCDNIRFFFQIVLPLSK
ncbi:MAG: carbohydrate ABC transporter permease, partial [Clostridium sp.]|nr:carbohydrate ABC transporter permease [Clostridium sp.]